MKILGKLVAGLNQCVSYMRFFQIGLINEILIFENGMEEGALIGLHIILLMAWTVGLTATILPEGLRR